MNQLLAVFDDPYLATPKNNYTAYVMRSTMDLLDHLYNNYALVSSTDMAANEKRIRASYNAEEPLESLIERLNECADFTTAASEPVLETQVVRIASVLVAKTRQYPEYCRAWKNQDDKSWTSFQAHFIKAHADIRERQKISRQGGYGANNLVGIKEAFANLAQATVVDRAGVTNLTDSNKNLVNQVAEQANHMATNDVSIDTMQKLIQKI